MSSFFKTNLFHQFRHLVVIFICSSAFLVNAQDRPWPELMSDPSVNIHDVRSKFDEEWQGKSIVKGRGYKQFKRWEYFMEQRCYPSGERFAPDAVYQAMKEHPEMFQQNNSMPGNWTYFGNTSVPAGGGAGRINSVRNLPGSTTTIFVCAPGGGLWKTTNSGTSWTILNTDFLASIGVSDVAIDYNNNNILYIATGDGDAGDTYSIGVWKSTDAGATWNPTGLNWGVTQTRTITRMIMHPTNSQILIAATSDGIYRTLNGGTTWTQEIGGNYKDIKFKPGTPATIYATGNNEQFLRSTDTGDTWSVISTGLPAPGNVSRMALAVSAANPAYVYILASDWNYACQGVYRSTDSGTSFTQRADASPNLLTWDENGTGSGGQGWYDLQIECSQSNAEIIYTGGVNVWKSSDGGNNWNCAGHWYGAAGIPYVHADIHALYWIPGTTHLLVGSDGGIFRTTDNAVSFSDLSSNLEIGQQYRLGTAATMTNRVITGWQDNGTNLKDGVSWSQVIGGDGMECAINPTNANIMYGELYYGLILKTTTGAGGFNTIVNNNGAGGTVDEGGAWVTPYVLGTNPNHIFVGKSRVYKSVNSGASWTAMANFGSGNINSLAVAPSDNNIIYASKGGSLYKSIDGNTFNAVGGTPGWYITYIAVHNTDPNKVWLTFSNYDATTKVYYSSNGGSSWSNISAGLPNIPANCVTFQNSTNNGIYVGTDAGVYYRDDVIGAWVPYMNGLPNVVVSELEIHYNSGTIRAATYGRGLWSAPLYTLPALDAALVQINHPTGTLCETSVTPSITLNNVGNATLTSMTMQYQVTGQPVQNYNWVGSLSTGNSTTINLPAYNYGAGAFTFTANIVTINGNAGDDNASNNSGSSPYYVTGGTNDVTLTLATDCWGSETSWTITDGLNNIVYSGGPYASLNTFIVPMCLPDGCFNFNIYDSFGDGVNGTIYGCGVDGNYFITDDNSGYQLVTMLNPNFGTGTSHNFCLPFVAVYGCTDPFADNYDPAANVDDGSCTYSCITYTLSILTDCWGEEVSWNITDGGGNIIASVAGNTLNDQTLYQWPLCMDLGCDYTFNIFDSFGDGLAGIASGCGINGNYVLTDNLGNTVFQMGAPNYGSGTNHVFCVGIPGCTDPIACNYDPDANADNGSCTYGAVNDQCSQAIPIIVNAPATNANNANTCFDGPNPNCGNSGATQMKDIWYSFVYPGGNLSISTVLGTNVDTRIAVYSSCGGAILACDDDSGPGTASLITFNCPSSLVAGNTYYIQAGGWADYNGTFTIQITQTNISGCNDPLASNFNACANVNDGSCIYPGCTDNLACNYDPGANQNDGSCTYPGCLDPAACNYNAGAGCSNASCTYPGCTTPGACNYNAAAGCDNGSCVYPGCNDPVACNYNAAAGCNDGSCTYAITYYADSDTDGYGDASISNSFCSPTSGWSINNTDCDDSNPLVYPGAPGTQQNIDNNCNGNLDPGEISPCTGDFNNDGVINISDLLLFIGNFGCPSACGVYDMTNDGPVNVSDLLIFMATYGTICP